MTRIKGRRITAIITDELPRCETVADAKALFGESSVMAIEFEFWLPYLNSLASTPVRKVALNLARTGSTTERRLLKRFEKRGAK